MAINDLEWLETWYRQQCNGDWEHRKGMLLQPLRSYGRHGWQLQIELHDTTAAGSAPRRMALCAIDGATPRMWLRCTLSSHRFKGEGADVEELVAVFRNWVDAGPVLEAVSAG